ncbi:MAG: SPOR domain-containing protein, partial [Bacteroidaceae bacterium]|nr:SPOR domain-containing protein [Bacteroidaceae bacterium]
DSVRIVIENVSIIDNPGKDIEKYGVVVGEFKQVFNAKSYRDRINNTENNSDSPAFVVMNTMKKYYVIYRSFNTKTEAAAFLKDKNNFKIKTQIDEVWILEMLKK